MIVTPRGTPRKKTMILYFTFQFCNCVDLFRARFGLKTCCKLNMYRQRSLPNKQTKNKPRSIYQYTKMAPRFSGQAPIFGVFFFVSKSLLGIEG